MKVRTVLQPPNTNLCGQASSATILGITLDESIIVYGSKGKTRTRQHIKVFRERGYVVPDKLVRFRTFVELPSVCLLHAVHPCWKHWMAWMNGRVYDPMGQSSALIITCRALSMRVTSYLPVIAPRPRAR